MMNAPAYDNKGQYISSEQGALAGYGNEIMVKAAILDVDPRLIVAIGFLEGKWGGVPGTAAAHNSWGFLTASGSLISYSSWGVGIGAEAQTLQNHIAAGQSTVADLYSGNNADQNGGLAAYCVGAGCAAGGQVVSSQLRRLGGDPTSLEDPW